MNEKVREHPIALSIAMVTLFLILLPLIAVIDVSVNPTAHQLFPPTGISFRWYATALNHEKFREAFFLSLGLAAAAASVSVLIGILCAIALTRYDFGPRRVIEVMLISPLLVPQVVIGMSALILAAQFRLIGSIFSLAILHVILTLPFAVKVVTAALLKADRMVERAAQSLGANPLRAFTLITLPMIKPGIITAAVFTFVTSFENFTATQFLIWNRSTLPVEIYHFIQTESDPTVAAVSAILMIGVAILIVLVNKFVGLQAVTGGRA